jgi:ribosomal-protein-alanine N-acetyltransferase
MLPVHIRWMIRRDMPEVLFIEGQLFETPWPEEEFLRFLRQRNNIGMVAEVRDQVVGFMIYGLHPDHIDVIHFAVHPAFMGEGIGRQMVEKLKGKLSNYRRTSLRLIAPESSLEWHLFLKAMGFKATEVLRGHFDDSDGYAFRFDHAEDCEAVGARRAAATRGLGF